MSDETDILIILGLGYLALTLIPTPGEIQSSIGKAVKTAVRPVVVRSSRTLPVTSGVWSLAQLFGRRTKSYRSRYTLG